MVHVEAAPERVHARLPACKLQSHIELAERASRMLHFAFFVVSENRSGVQTSETKHKTILMQIEAIDKETNVS